MFLIHAGYVGGALEYWYGPQAGKNILEEIVKFRRRERKLLFICSYAFEEMRTWSS